MNKKEIEQLVARLAAQNPCSTQVEILEMAKDEMKQRSPTPAEASENRRRWFRDTKHDPLYNLEKALPILENTDA
jgi:hypothetical protein